MKKYLINEEQSKKIVESLMENINVPMGALNDPDAPWNEKEPNIQKGIRKDTTGLDLVKTDYNEYALVRKDNVLYYVDLLGLKDVIDSHFGEYLDVPYNDIDDVYEYSEADIDDDTILSYFADNYTQASETPGYEGIKPEIQNYIVRLDPEIIDNLKDVHGLKFNQ